MKFDNILQEISMKKLGINTDVKGDTKKLTKQFKKKKTNFKRDLSEKVKDGHKRLASSAGGSATPKKVDNYMDKLEKNGDIKDLNKQIKKKGLKGKAAERYKWAVIHKRIKGHFN